MKKKANALAHGDFTVDFHGDDYAQEIVELADALNYARDELSKTDAMQKELIANVSHDFKTPLTMIKAYASMIIEISGDDKEKREKHASTQRS
jgi:signal transduction histidine kinase